MTEYPRQFEFMGWKFDVGAYTSSVIPFPSVTVTVTGPRNQVVTVGFTSSADPTAEVCFEVQDKEKSSGYSGDCAVDRYVPGAVVVRAVQEYEAAMVMVTMHPVGIAG